jgi:hypothetical protein
VALVCVDLLRDRSPALWRGRVVALAAFAVTWSGVGVLKEYSSPLGPGTSYARMQEAGSNVDAVASAICIEPRLMPGDMWATTIWLLPTQLGLGHERLANAGFPSQQTQGVAGLWLPVFAVLALGAGRGVTRAWRHGPTQATWFGLYLLVLGAQAVLVYGITRCGHTSLLTLRYLLLTLLAPAGVVILTLDREPRALVRGLVVLVLAAWGTACAADHVRLFREHFATPPAAGYRELARHLEAADIRYIVTDYWTGYHVAFLTGERIKALTDFERIHEYTLAVRANRDLAVEVRRRRGQEPCPGAAIVSAWFVCTPQTSGP